MWGNVIRIKRKRLGLSRKQLAEKVGCSVDTIKSWEHSAHMPRAYYRKDLVEALGLTEEVFKDV